MMGVALIIVIVLLVGWLYFGSDTDMADNDGNKIEAIVYKSPNCGCCVGHAGELRKNGFNVEVITINDMDSIKEQYNIPREMESCHTTIVGDYFIEGHMPISAIKKLLDEKPDVDGIALPDMPSGSPGMPGVKRDPWEIYQLKDGNYKNYLTL